MFELFKTAKNEPTQNQEARNGHQARTAEQRRTVSPRVDIRETDTAVTVVADMPGVSAEGVDVRVHGDVLTLRGTSRVQEPERFQAIWREYAARDYERNFRLGHAIDTERIAANAKNGIVRVTLPKRAAVQPKRVAVTAS